MSQSDLLNKLTAALVRNGLSVDGLENLRRLSGGAMQETWAFDAISGGSTTAMVLRRLPEGRYEVRDGNITLETQAELLKATRGNGVPGPDVLAVLTRDDDLGAGFVMNFVSGETVPPKILRQPELAAVRPLMARQCGEILARIHSTPIDRLGELPIKTADESIAHLRSLYEGAGCQRPVLELAFKWLQNNPLTQVETPGLVHADFRNGNLIVDQTGVAAVLDWERAFIGDPAYDVGWLTMGSWRFGQLDKPVGGFGVLEDLQEGYAAVSGQRIDPARIKYWRVFGSLDWGVGTLAFSKEAIETDRSLERAAIGRRCSEAEIDLLRLISGEESDFDV